MTEPNNHSSLLKKLISKKRLRESTGNNENLTQELGSDRSRILYSSPFRRLSKKAQVFSLENNAAIRSRITHSLEVADVGKWIAYYITEELIKTDGLEQEYQLPIMYAVENACLLHDIGNPPFGHFGETAIKNWFQDNWKKIYEKVYGRTGYDKIEFLMQDFLEFDGNPQGLRIVLRLQRDQDEYGLNLTYTTILSLIKYPRSTTEKKTDGLKKKPGYFESEKDIVEKIKNDLGISMSSRYPLAYIMEAADDIAYCISDIEDGIEKGVISAKEFFEELNEEWEKIKKIQGEKDSDFPSKFPIFPIGKINNEKDNLKKFFKFRISYSREAIQIAKNNYISNKDKFFDNRVVSLFPENSEHYLALKCLKNVARKKLFRSSEAENPELAGYKIITGLLEAFKPLLSCTEENFDRLVKGKSDPSQVSGRDLDIQWRLFNKLPQKHLLAYQDQVSKFSSIPEWFFRCHLIVDCIAGMTDGFALELYQLLNGIRLN